MAQGGSEVPEFRGLASGTSELRNLGTDQPCWCEQKAQGRVSCLVPFQLSDFPTFRLSGLQPFLGLGPLALGLIYFANSVTAADSIFTFAASDEPDASEFNDVAS
jgi:hypothetical protein